MATLTHIHGESVLTGSYLLTSCRDVAPRQVYIGAIVPLGAAEKEGHLRAGDELIAIDGVVVKGRPHKQVLDLMTNAARNGQVLLTVRRTVIYRGAWKLLVAMVDVLLRKILKTVNKELKNISKNVQTPWVHCCHVEFVV